jgi:hypothetical protein
MILGKDTVLKSWTSSQFLEETSSNLSKIVEDLKKEQPYITKELFIPLFDNAKVEINEYYTKCTIGGKVIYFDYCTRDFQKESKMVAWRQLIWSETLESLYLAEVFGLIESKSRLIEYQGKSLGLAVVHKVLFPSR